MLTKLVNLAGLVALSVLLAGTLSKVVASPAADESPPAQAGLEAMNTRLSPADGVPKISEGEALAAANEFVPGLAKTATSISSQYVLFSKSDYYDELPDGTREYKFQDRPVWLVAYGGVEIPSHGGNPLVAHEFNVVVDAETGKVHFGYAYR